MRSWLVGLAALTGAALITAPAVAQTVIVGPGGGVGVGVGAGYGPGFYDDDDDTSYYGPGYTPPPYAYWGPPRAVTTPAPGQSYYGPPPSAGYSYYNAPSAARAGELVREAVPGECGTFMYYSNGRCLDARNK